MTETAVCVDCGAEFAPAFEGDVRCGECFVADFLAYLARKGADARPVRATNTEDDR